jgi:hypothetical protein
MFQIDSIHDTHQAGAFVRITMDEETLLSGRAAVTFPPENGPAGMLVFRLDQGGQRS